MAEQFSLFDVPPASDGLFFAIFPPAEPAARIAEIAQQQRAAHGLKGKPHPAERLHVSLFALGEYAGLPRGIVSGAIEAAATVSFAAFDVAFDRVASFAGKPGSQPLVLRGRDGVADLAAFREELFIAMKKAGLGREEKPQFTPHVTLMYGDRRAGEQAIEPVSWTVNEFVLVHSLLGRTTYKLLGRWPLRG